MKRECLHCALGRTVVEFLDKNPDIDFQSVAFDFGQIVRDLLRGEGIEPADASPDIMGPIFTGFMQGAGVKMKTEVMEYRLR